MKYTVATDKSCLGRWVSRAKAIKIAKLWAKQLAPVRIYDEKGSFFTV